MIQSFFNLASLHNDPVFPYGFIWPFFAAINLFNVIYIRTKVAAIVQGNSRLKRDSGIFLKWLFIFAVLPFLILSLLQWLGGFHHAFYVFSNDYHNPYVVAGWAVFVLDNLGILYVLLWGGGANMLIKFRRAFRSMPESEREIKAMAVFSSLLAFVVLLGMIVTNVFGKVHG
jgi:hypothetical protein